MNNKVREIILVLLSTCLYVLFRYNILFDYDVGSSISKGAYSLAMISSYTIMFVLYYVKSKNIFIRLMNNLFMVCVYTSTLLFLSFSSNYLISLLMILIFFIRYKYGVDKTITLDIQI